MKKLPFGVFASSLFIAVLITAADSFVGAPNFVHAAGNGCTVMTQCPATAQSNGRTTFRFAGADVYQRQDGGGAVTTITTKPDCKLPAGQCLVIVRDEAGNTVRTYQSTSLEEGAPRQSPIPRQDVVQPTTNYTPIYTVPQGGILYSPTRMYGDFYESYTDYDNKSLLFEVPRTPRIDYYRTIYNEYAQPAPEPVYTEPRRRVETISVDSLASEQVSLEPHDNPQDEPTRIGAISGNSGATFIDPDSAPDIPAELEEGTGEDRETSGPNLDSFEEGGGRRIQPGDTRDVADIADDAWIRGPQAPVIRNEVRGNIGLVSEDLEYLKQLEKHDLCTAQCLGEAVFRENELRILRALDDQMTHGYPQIVSLEGGTRDIYGNAKGDGPTRYFVVLQDARGETFYCGASGICTPSDMFLPSTPRTNPIALAAAPVEIERAASRLSYGGGPVSYALNEIVGSGVNVFEKAIAPSPVFAPRPNYPACSLLTSLIGACSNWQ